MSILKDETKEKELKEKLAKVEEAIIEEEAKELAKQLGCQYLNLISITPQITALKLIKENEAREAFCAPFMLRGKIVSLACKNPYYKETQVAIDNLKKQGYEVEIFVVSLNSLKQLWKSYSLIAGTQKKEITGKIDIDQERLAQITAKVRNIKLLQKEIEEFQSPYISQILEIILAGGLATDASDIHIEAEEERVRLRYRLDGELVDIASLSHAYYRSLLSRIKLLSGMKINIRSAPQDGRFSIKVAELAIEIRVSVIPGAYGENIVLRILNPKTIQLELKDLGFREDDLVIIEEQIKRPNGIILNTGPTGSGKTTTLYAFLRKIYQPEIKIITIEDPIEYHLEGITQTQVNPTRNYTFATGLRSILRQDPDVILVGEIRDEETAEIAMHAALTGHLVLSTLHTNDAAGTIPRLLDMGIQSAILAPALNLAIAQRLVRKLCQFCRKTRNLSSEEFKKIKIWLENLPSRVKKPVFSEKMEIYEAGEGCEKCNFTGYKGRTAVAELLVVDEEMQELINQPERPPTVIQIKNLAKRKGMTTMQDDALLKILAGITDFKEAEAILGPLF